MSWRAWLAFLALGAIWGLPYLFIKIAVQELPPLLLAWSRIVLATVVLLPIAWQRGALRGLRDRLWPILAFALAEFVIPFSTIAVGEQWIASSVTAILIATVPLFVLGQSRWFGIHDPVDVWRWTGILIGLLGVLLLVGLGSVQGPRAWTGVACVLVATVGYATGPLIIQRYLRDMESLGPLATSLLLSALLLTGPAWLHRSAHMPSTLALISVAVLGLVCTAAAMLLMFYLIRSAGAARASLVTYLNPAVATLLGVILLQERLGPGGYIGFALIMAGSWLGTRTARPVPGPLPVLRPD